jgi:hypothetical protein
MKKIPFDQMIIGLDDLFFRGKPLQTIQDGIERVDTIEAYLEATGYTWDDILDHMLAEELPYDQAQAVSTRIGHTALS